jgi:hypothetical protein
VAAAHLVVEQVTGQAGQAGGLIDGAGQPPAVRVLAGGRGDVVTGRRRIRGGPGPPGWTRFAVVMLAGLGGHFRTAPDTLLAVHANGRVSFEADHLDQAHRAGWSVLVHGHAHTVTDEREVKRLEDRTRLEPWAGGARDVYVRITPTRISGRCIEPGWAAPWRQTPKAQTLCPEPVATGRTHR